MASLAQQVVLITGAGRGLGFAMASAFAAEGAGVAIVDIDPAAASAAALQLDPTASRVRGYGCDVSNERAFGELVAAVLSEFGRIDVLVSNAIWIRYEPVEEVAEATLDRILAVGVKAVFWAAQAAVRLHDAGQGGHCLINITSPVGDVGFLKAASYTAAKGAVSALVRQMATELGPRGIRVNGIAPGPIPTPGASSVVDADGYRKRRERTPMGRLAEPEDIAAAAVFLASDAARLISGEIVHVDGGLVASGV